MFLRSSKKHHNQIYLQDPIGADGEGNEITILDILAAADVDMPANIDLKSDIYALYELLPKVLNAREQQVICERYGLCGREILTQKTVAAKMGISRSYVSRIEKKALKKLSEALGSRY